MIDETIYKKVLAMHQPTAVSLLRARAITFAPWPFFFRCNICGRITPTVLRWAVYRDFPSCFHCGSTSRVRQIVHALSYELFGKSIPMFSFPKRLDICGCDLSGWSGYASWLASTFNYRNTFYHQDPHLDITAVPDDWVGRFDFVIASDVFEHVVPPIEQAFAGLRALLKPGGFAIFSVPYLPISKTEERYPELYDFHIENDEKGPILINMTRDGRRQEFRDLVFHGGDGLVLEMRCFAESDLLAQFSKAGFTATQVPRYVPRCGILDFSAHSHLFVLRPAGSAAV